MGGPSKGCWPSLCFVSQHVYGCLLYTVTVSSAVPKESDCQSDMMNDHTNRGVVQIRTAHVKRFLSKKCVAWPRSSARCGRQLAHAAGASVCRSGCCISDWERRDIQIRKHNLLQESAHSATRPLLQTCFDVFASCRCWQRALCCTRAMRKFG